MNLMDLLQQAGGDDSVDALAGALGIGREDANRVVGALTPALARSLQNQAQGSGGLDALRRALEHGSHEQYLDNPGLMADSSTRKDGDKILGHLFGSKDVSRNVAARAAAETGVDAGLIKKALPLIAGLTMGALSRKSSKSGGEVSGDRLGGLLGGLFDRGDDDGFGVDDVLNLARKFF